MSKNDGIKSDAETLQRGLKKLGADRVIALSVHKSKELVAELEETVAQLLQKIEAAG